MTARTKLDQFRGRLSLEQIAEGMTAAGKNACRLLEDAQLLFENGRYPSALALSILAIEEGGKLPILRRMVTATDDRQLVGLWKEYRSHTKKNVAWMFADLINRTGPTKLEDLRPLFAHNAEHPYILDQLKQIALYTDSLGEAQWSNPTAVVEHELAEAVLGVARYLVKADAVTVRELELWNEHMSEFADGTDMEGARRALSQWYAAMQAEGLRPQGANVMQTFVTTGLGVPRGKDRGSGDTK
ncbi:hypothetical protein BGV68_02750 [Burkholderia ubonensis]|uniref:AbiV family abortive infection protein n=1 Tax=Burkholderia TaxID=32008 RepID=UPI000923D432|nr:MULTISPECIES: AbiV family abortive infection protein [Burkholderia]OJA63579.1 hypothetical protein BGV68_02750 [Burkholderia ubonensis]